MDEKLQHLADAAGIEPRYWDIQGNLHERSADSARALLAAMGIAAWTHEDIDASLKRLQEEEWREVLPPVLVAREHRDIEVPVRLPGGNVQRRLPWSLLREDGRQQQGEWLLENESAVDEGEADGTRLKLWRMRLPAQPAGFHRIHAAEIGELSLIVVPPRCYVPPDWETNKYWGLALQLYGVRSARNWGMGDFGDLARLATWPVDVIGINPLHALFLDDPQSPSPYAPSSRLFINPLYLDVPAVADFLGLPLDQQIVPAELGHLIEKARAADIVDYPAVAGVKLAALERLFHAFCTGAGTGKDEDFRAFIDSGGPDLGRFIMFEAFSEHFGNHDWQKWPQEYHNPSSGAVQSLAAELNERCAFYAFLQWLSDLQLGAASKGSRDRGMRLGLYKDLAVSSDAQSADHWAYQQLFMRDARVGAPPDPFNEIGQEWGIVPLNPRRLRAQGYGYFIALLRANMRHAGVLRIDHVMGLMRLFLIPAGAMPKHGAYIRFPFEDLLGIVALESTRNSCVVIGEDLGTVPMGFRERMAEAGILSSRVLYFEREHGRFRSPGEFPPLAAVSVSTHDLATLRGYWTEADILAKEAIGVFGSPEEKARALEERASEKAALIEALAREGLLPSGVSADTGARAPWSQELATAVHAYLARCESRLLLVQLDDLAGEVLQANLPGSTSGYPSWRRRLEKTVEELSTDPQIGHACTVIATERGGRPPGY